jgi:hypothetical protein
MRTEHSEEFPCLGLEGFARHPCLTTEDDLYSANQNDGKNQNTICRARASSFSGGSDIDSTPSVESQSIKVYYYYSTPVRASPLGVGGRRKLALPRSIIVALLFCCGNTFDCISLTNNSKGM